MKTITESFETPVYGQYDIAIIGGGPSGCGAALAAARMGAKCILVEKLNALGGMWTAGLVNPIFDHAGKGGILRELLDELEQRGVWGGFRNQCFHYEYMKHLLDCKLREAGVEVLLNTNFSRTICRDKTVSGVICENIDGRLGILAKYVLDCTGDGHVAADAGCPFELGDDGDYSKCQAMTLMFLVGNIPEEYSKGALIRQELQEVYDKGGKEIPFTMPYLIPIPRSRFGVVQFTHIYEHDPMSQKSVNAATVEGRRQMIEAYELLTTYNETFRDLELIQSAPALGIRESRRIIGEYTLTADDVREGAEFEDAVARGRFGVDIHTKSNKGQINMKIRPYEIPLRCLMPNGYRGIYVIGRCISGDQIAMASYRVTGTCFEMGENAGRIIACLCKETNEG